MIDCPSSHYQIIIDNSATSFIKGAFVDSY